MTGIIFCPVSAVLKMAHATMQFLFVKMGFWLIAWLYGPIQPEHFSNPEILTTWQVSLYITCDYI